MEIWLEQSCSSRSRRRRCSGSRPTWPAGCPWPTSILQMTHWPHLICRYTTSETPSTPLPCHFANPRFLLMLYIKICMFMIMSTFVLFLCRTAFITVELQIAYKHTQNIQFWKQFKRPNFITCSAIAAPFSNVLPFYIPDTIQDTLVSGLVWLQFPSYFK